jgi:putative endonuclease
MNPVRNSQWYVYILYSKKDNFFYTGCTNNLTNRIKKHNNKEVISTKDRLPIILIYTEICINKKDAYNREKYLKSGMGKRYIKNRLKNYFTKINKVNF